MRRVEQPAPPEQHLAGLPEREGEHAQADGPEEHRPARPVGDGLQGAGLVGVGAAQPPGQPDGEVADEEVHGAVGDQPDAGDVGQDRVVGDLTARRCRARGRAGDGATLRCARGSAPDEQEGAERGDPDGDEGEQDPAERQLQDGAQRAVEALGLRRVEGDRGADQQAAHEREGDALAREADLPEPGDQPTAVGEASEVSICLRKGFVTPLKTCHTPDPIRDQPGGADDELAGRPAEDARGGLLLCWELDWPPPVAKRIASTASAM